MKWLSLLALLCVGAAAASAQPIARNMTGVPPTDAPAYSIIDLGTLSAGAGTRTLPRAIQNPVLATSIRPPLVVGMGTADGGTARPFLWTSEYGMIDGIAGLPGTGEALGVNQFGDYVGRFAPEFGPAPYPQRAFLASTRMSAVHFMPTLGGTGAAANDINDSMVIVGWSHNAAQQRRATIWRDMGSVTGDLGTFGGAASEALAINRFGQVVGWAQRPDGVSRAFLHNPLLPLPVLMTDLGGLSPGSDAVARDINESGMIVGSSTVRGPVITPAMRVDRRATLWRPATASIINLGALHIDDPVSEAMAVNNHGSIVGWSGHGPAVSVITASRPRQRAFLWDGQQMHDLNDLIPPNSGWVLHAAEDINDGGMIVGWGVRVSATGLSRETRGFLLIPHRP